MKFKVGDRVRIIKNGGYLFGIVGDYLKITHIDNYPNPRSIQGILERNNIKTWFNPKDLQKVSNNRGKNPRGADGRFLPKDILDKMIADKMSWGFGLPNSLTINGVKYVKEAHV